MRERYGREVDADDVFVQVFDTGAENKSLKTVYRQYCEFTFLDFGKAAIDEAYNSITTLCSSYVNDWKKFLKDAGENQWYFSVSLPSFYFSCLSFFVP